MHTYEFRKINRMVFKYVHVHPNRMFAPKAFKWETKSSYNLAYINNISTYKQFLKAKDP